MDNYDYNALANEVVRRGINMFESFDDWTKGAFALSNLGKDGLDIFKTISSLSQKYNASECERKFKNALSTGNRIGIATFIYMCQQHGIDTNRYYVKDSCVDVIQPVATSPNKIQPSFPIVSIEKDFLNRSLDKNLTSDFVCFLKSLVDNVDQLVDVANRYYLGVNHDRHVVYWYVDKDNIIRYGKVMSYGTDGHRDPSFCPLSIPKELSKKGLLPTKYAIKQTLFGEHLLHYPQYVDKTIGVVESEKTAVICSLFLPSLLWVATGSMGNVQTERMEVVKNRHVILYPDSDPESLAFNKWEERATELNGQGWNILVSDYLEKVATPKQRKQKIDIADLLIENLQTYRDLPSETNLASL
jgi:hypothetical protein